MKTETKHTPGPWTQGHGEERYNADLIWPSTGNGYICNVGGLYQHRTFKELEKEERLDEAMANAKLIAAAPELLEALQDAVDNCLWRSDSEIPLSKEESHRIWEKAMKAIKKATE